MSSEIVAMLVRAGANPELRNEFGVKASELCIKRGHGGALITHSSDISNIRQLTQV